MIERRTLGRRGKVGLMLGLPLLRLLASTWRYSLRNTAALRELRDRKQPFVWSLWHGQLLPLLWLHRRQGVRVLISEHRDGEIIAQLAESLGYRTARGSTGKRGERALLSLVRALEVGEEVAVTPDGPRGPALEYQPGAILAAARAGTPVLPVAVHVKHAWQLRSWDRFVIPKPFARITVAYGDPVEIEADSAREAAARTPLLQSAMRATVERTRG